MNSSVRRAVAFAAVATISLVAPIAGTLTAVPFALIAVAGRTLTSGRLFRLLARPGDRIEGRLRGLVGFTLAATALALVSALAGLPVSVFVATTLLVGYGNLLERILCDREDSLIRQALAFAGGGALAAFGGLSFVALMADVALHGPTAAFLALVGALVGSLIRSVQVERDDPLVMLSVALVLWAFVGIDPRVDAFGLVVAVAVAGAFGYVSWLLQTASVPGMLTGVIISLATIVLGGYGWFAVLVAFFGIGSLSSKYRYEEKRDLGTAEDNEGARGTRNVLGNAAVALVAVVGFAAADHLSIAVDTFRFAFAGSIATAMADTLSSELGVLFGKPRLVTTLERVEPGTDGGVTFEGALAGAGGGAIVAVSSLVVFGLGPLGAVLIALAGVFGMFVDSVLGATIEGRWIGNQGVNFLATLAGAILAGSGAILLGFV